MSGTAESTDEPGQNSGVRSVLRALDLLGLFTEERMFWSVRELTEATGLAKTTVLRLVATLERRGLLWSDGSGQISAGPGLLRWSSLARAAWQPPESARRVMRALSDTCGETVNLYVRADLSRICVEQQEGSQNVRHVVRVGDELPLWAGAAGQVLLIGADDRLLGEVAAQDPRGRSAAQLRAETEEVRQAGYVLTHGEREVGASGLAAPVFGAEGGVLAALALGGPTPRFTEKAVADFVPAVGEAAARITRIGFGGRK